MKKIPLKNLLKAALAEDIGKGDVTSNLLIPQRAKGSASILARENGIFSGQNVAAQLFRIADPSLRVQFLIREGQRFKEGDTILKVRGRVRSILKAERTVLNFLGHLSGVATLTAEFVKRMEGYPVQILDTRKTTPLWRDLEKKAVLAGKGANHRMGLYDAIFVKENHRRYGQLSELKNKKYEIEVRNLKELVEALTLKPQVILFDNFAVSDLRQAVQVARETNPKIILEASGGITLQNAKSFAATGVNQISVGALTHSVKSINLSLLVE